MNTIPTYSFFNTGRQEKMVDVFRWTDPEPYLFDTPHCHDYHEIMIFYKGGGSHDVNFKSYPITTQSVHIAPKTFLHQLNRSPKSSGFTIAITDLFIDQLAQFEPSNNYSLLFQEEQIAQLSKKDFSDLEYLFNEIQKHKISDALMQNLCAGILIKLFSLLGTHATNTSLVNKDIRKVLEENFMKRLSTQQYADILNMSAVNLNLKLKKSTGKTIIQLQDDMLITKIKQNIYSSIDEFKEIAHRFGFDDYAHFSKFFKNHSGYSPTEYKNLFKNVQAIDNK